jgi:nucleoside-diphosphate-sugar epimerase
MLRCTFVLAAISTWTAPVEWSGMDVLVTGSRGLIGQQVMIELRERGHQALGFDLRDGWDVNDSPTLRSHARHADAVIHLATPSSPLLFQYDPAGCWNQTVQSMQTVLEGTRGIVVCASSAKVYGSIDVPAHEDMCLAPPPTLYTSAKRECERLCLQAVANGHRSVRICRIFVCYGSQEAHKADGADGRPPHASTPYTFVQQALSGKPIEVYGDGTQRRDFIHVDDVARGIADVVEARSVSPILNLGTGIGHSFAQLIAFIDDAVGGTSAVTSKPKPSWYSSYMVANVERTHKELSWHARISLPAGISRLVEELGQV